MWKVNQSEKSLSLVLWKKVEKRNFFTNGNGINSSGRPGLLKMKSRNTLKLKKEKGGPWSVVSSYPSHSPSSNVAALHKTVTVNGVNEATVVGVLTKRNSAHHQQIKAAHLQEKGKPLDEALKKALQVTARTSLRLC